MVAPGWQGATIVLVTGSLKNKLPEMFVVTYSPFFKRFREHQAPRKSEVIDFQSTFDLGANCLGFRGRKPP